MPDTLSIDDLTPDQLDWLTAQLAAEHEADGISVLPPGDRQAEVPSLAQQRLWFLDQLGGPSPLYTIARSLRLVGNLDVSALESAISAVVARHEPLRTTFGPDAGAPRQHVRPAELVVLPVDDLSVLPNPDAEAEAVLREQAHRPFRLDRDPMLRARLLRLGEREHVLFLAIHHIAADGWSMPVLLRDLAVCYQAACSGCAPVLPPLPIRYTDYAAWHRAQANAEAMQPAWRYWLDRLRPPRPALDLPADRPRPAVPSEAGGVRTRLLDADLTAALRRLARAENTSLFTVLLTAYAALLHRYSGQTDLLIGTPAAGRSRAETADLVGFFVNTLVMRLGVDGDMPAREAITATHRAVLDAHAHQDLPFERLVEALQPERDLSQSPLFSVWFALQPDQAEGVRLPGLDLRMDELDTGTAKFELSLYVHEHADRLTCAAEYAADRFEPETVGRFLAHFETLLCGLVADPDTPLGALPILPEAERETVLRTWNATRQPYRFGETLHGPIWQQAWRTPEAVALRVEGETVTYAELTARADALARELSLRGLGRGDRVGVCLERSAELVVALLGVLRAGAAYLPLDPDLPPARLAMLVEDARPGAVVSMRRYADRLPETAETIWLDGPLSAPDDLALPIPCASDPAYVLYTSGSTGRPKGVVVRHSAIVNRLRWMQEAYALDPGEAVLQKTPFSFDVSVWEFFWPLREGARLVVARPGGHRDPAYLLDLIAGEAVSTLHFVPSMLAAFLPEATPDRLGHCRALRRVVCSGEALPPALVRDTFRAAEAAGLDLELHNLYGPTEAAVDVSFWPCTPADADRPSVPIGRPVANTQLYVLDARGEPTPIGVPGELHLGGVQLADGYLGRPDLTAERFVPNPFGPGRLYRTGDRARWLPEGAVEYLGRLDDQVKLRGVRIEPAEIEAVLAEHPAVREVVAAVQSVAPGDDRLAAYVVPDPDFVSADDEAEQVAAWQAVYDDAYAAEVDDATFDTVTWVSSFTGEPIPPAAMAEWVDETAARVLALRPADQPGRVLELGCGTGLVLFRVAPHVREYVGTDVSGVVVERLREAVAANPALSHVTLATASADDLSGVKGSFDVIVLNSVVQYFPSAEYLERVVAGAMRRLRPGGALFLGDVRRLGLLEAFHAAVALHRAPDDTPASALRQALRRAVVQEEELLVEPAYFHELAARVPEVGRAAVWLKRGAEGTEMTRFRYDVTLFRAIEASGDGMPDSVELGAAPPLPVERAWAPGLDLAALARSARTAPVRLTGIPNARVADAVALADRLRADEGTAAPCARDLRAAEPVAGLDPEALWRAAEAEGVAAVVTWGEALDRLDVTFGPPALVDRLGTPAPRTLRMGAAGPTASRPLLGRFARRAAEPLRRFAAEHLPEALVPSEIVFLDAIPLTPSGKRDRRALPPLVPTRSDAARFVAPRTETETQLAALWQALLGVPRVGAEDGFFDLGGHSLLATQLALRLDQTFGVRLPLRALFEAQTLEAQAARLDAARWAAGLSNATPDAWEEGAL